MGKIKIVVGLFVLAALIIGGYFYLQNRQDKTKESLSGSISTTLKESGKQDSQSNTAGKIYGPSESGEAEKSGSIAALSSKITISGNTVETIYRPESPVKFKIQERILKPQIPSPISEKRFKPIAPPRSAKKPPIILIPPKNTEDNEEPEEEQEEPAATSTPAVMPQVSIYLSGYSITSRQFTVNWQSSSTATSTFDVQTKMGLGDWQNWLASTTATSTVFEVPQDMTIYYFRARAIANASSTSDWQEVSAPIYFYPVVINEIAWSGTSASSSADEWIELYNKTDFEINLSGWLLVEVKSSTTTIVTLKNTISPKSFYLIERDTSGDAEKDMTIRDIAADYTGLWGGSGLANAGEDLRLVDPNNNIVDRENCGEGCDIWNTKVKHGYRSIERVNPYLASDIPNNWAFNNGSTTNGMNIDGLPINGTPKAQNSVFNLEFFYLYPAQNTTATSTFLEWTPSYMENLNEYKVIRSFDVGFGVASTTIVAATTATNFFDETLESETKYYYKISACDLSEHCASSNIASTTTWAFPFFWSEPQLLYEISTSTPEGDAFDFVLDANNQPEILWSNSSSTLEVGSSTETTVNLLNNKNKPYIFWADISSGGESIYFIYLKDNGQWQAIKTILEIPHQILRLRALINSQNIAHLVWENNQQEIWYTYGRIE